MAARLLTIVFTMVSSLSVSGCNTTIPEATDPTVSHSQQPKCELSLGLPSKFAAKTHEPAKIEIKNAGNASVKLVMPGDGSAWGWRTPLVGWSFLPVDSKDQHPKEPQRPVGARCGNINSLKPDEVFVLKPGATKELNEWVGFPHPLSPGKYRVVFYYTNVPDLEWSGLPLGKHDEGAMRRLKGSSPISLVSNEVQVEITN